MKKDYNMGLAVLRMVMCFMVVLCHCWYDGTEMRGGGCSFWHGCGCLQCQFL